LEAAQEGDERAFARLWRGCNPVLLRYLVLRVPDAAADVASEVWVHVVRDLQLFHGDELHFRAWLITVARDRAKQWVRRSQRENVVGLELEGLDAHLPPDTDPETLIVTDLSAQDVVRLVGQILPPLQAEAVVLRVVGQLDVDQAAAVMNRRPGTVRVLTHRGLRGLARKLERPANARAAMWGDA